MSKSPPMVVLDKWERKLGWISFPGLLRYYALFHVLVFALQFINPAIREMLDFDRAKIFSGEVWRAVTFVFVTEKFSGVSPLVFLFLFMMVMIAFMISDALESAWGVFRSTIFYYVGFLGLLAGNFLYANPPEGSGFFIYVAAFFAFATLFPRQEFLMFFVLPVQVRWLAILLAVVMAVGVFSQPAYLGFFVLGFGNYLLWAGIPALRSKQPRMDASQQRSKFVKKSESRDVAFHRCETCDRTELSNPELEFRMAGGGKEYCGDHLPD